MTFLNAFRLLSQRLGDARQSFEELYTLVSEDHPTEGPRAIVGDFTDETITLMGLLQEAAFHAQQGQAHLEQYRHHGAAILHLVSCQEVFDRAAYTFQAGLLSYRKLRRLKHMAKKESGEWLEWSQCVHDGIERCQQAVQSARQALFSCWQELAEKASSSPAPFPPGTPAAGPPLYMAARPGEDSETA